MCEHEDALRQWLKKREATIRGLCIVWGISFEEWQELHQTLRDLDEANAIECVRQLTDNLKDAGMYWLACAYEGSLP